MDGITLPQANTSIVQSFKDLNGTSPSFVLPYGFYYLTYKLADNNIYTTVTVNDLANPGNVLLKADWPIGSPNIGSGGQFQTIGTPINVVTSGPTLEVIIEG